MVVRSCEMVARSRCEAVNIMSPAVNSSCPSVNSRCPALNSLELWVEFVKYDWELLEFVME